MKLKQTIYYQLWDYRSAMLSFYGAVVAMHLVLFLARVTDLVNVSAHLDGGLSAFSFLFLFICGLVSLHELLPMCLQNGVSRKTMFLSRLAVTGIVAAVMAVVDTVLSLVIDWAAGPLWRGSSNLFLNVSGLAHTGFETLVGANLFSVLYSFCLLVLASALGYFLIALFYRLSIRGRVALGAALGFLLVFGLPGVKIVDSSLLGGSLASFVENYLWPLEDVIQANPFAQMGLWLGSSAVLSGLSWLLLRKAVVQR